MGCLPGLSATRPPNVLRLLTVWRFDTLLGVAAAALAVAYVIAVLRLRRRGDSWPPGRLVAWLFGCAALVFTTGSGVRAYGSAMFSVHMGEHMTLNMFIPVFLVLGAPITLALRALPSPAPVTTRPAGMATGWCIRPYRGSYPIPQRLSCYSSAHCMPCTSPHCSTHSCATTGVTSS